MASKMPQYIRLKQRFRCTSDMYASKEKQVKVDVIHFRSTIVWALARFPILVTGSEEQMDRVHLAREETWRELIC